MGEVKWYNNEGVEEERCTETNKGLLERKSLVLKVLVSLLTELAVRFWVVDNNCLSQINNLGVF